VQYSQISGAVHSGDGLEADITAHVTEDGTIVADSLTNNQGVSVERVEGKIQDGVFEGTYSFDGEQGFFAGSRGGVLQIS